MPYKDPEKRREAARIGMQKRRASEKGLTTRVNVNPVNPASSTVNREKTNNRTSLVSGQYESGYWSGICPVCNHHNKMDPRRSFRPFEICEHLVRLEESGKASPFIFKRGLTHKSVNPAVNPPGIAGTSSLSNFAILYRKGKDDFTLVYLAGDKIRPLRSLRTGLENGIPELSGLRIIREKIQIKEADAL
ncbi:MAG: hypothetical protein ACYCT2_04520 [Thermoplasmataceae archaeon]